MGQPASPAMNRREFIRTSLVLSAGVAAGRRLGGQAAPMAAAAPASMFRPLRGDIGVFTGRGGTIGWLSSKDALAVVDTQFPDTARICLAGIPGIAGRTIDATINTHHHPDHTGGNAVIIFEKANVIHMGDLVFNRLYPVVDRPGGATLRGWIKSLEACAAAYPADAIYIFGHGSSKFGITGPRGD